MHNCVINLKILTKQNYGKYKSQKLDEDVEPCTAEYSGRKLSESGAAPPERLCRVEGRMERPVGLPWVAGPQEQGRAPREHVHTCAHPNTHPAWGHTPYLRLQFTSTHLPPTDVHPQLHTPHLYADTLITNGQ